MEYLLWQRRLGATAAFLTLSAATAMVCAQQAPPLPKGKTVSTTPTQEASPAAKVVKVGYDDTPHLPGGKWRVHDKERPMPRVVAPPAGNQGVADTAPSDAIALFDGKDTSQWHTGSGSPITWKVVDSTLEVVKGGGNITTRQEFGNCQLHLEWLAPSPARGDSQGRSNSGIFFLGKYEIQVLDCYNNPTYADGHAGAVYGQTPPLVNACRKPGEWQTYDIFFTTPIYEGGKLTQPGHVTVLLNGIVVQNHTEILGQTSHRTLPGNTPHGLTGPISLQDHGDPIRFRNIWVRPL